MSGSVERLSEMQCLFRVVGGSVRCDGLVRGGCLEKCDGSRSGKTNFVSIFIENYLSKHENAHQFLIVFRWRTF